MYLINLEAKIAGVVLVTDIDENEKLVKIECTLLYPGAFM
jgi:hypothetical protein